MDELRSRSTRRFTPKRLIGLAAALLVLAVVAFQGWGMWARRRPPSFSKGGAFGLRTSDPTASTTPTLFPSGASSVAASNPPVPRPSGGGPGPSVTPAADTSLMQRPALGVWWFRSSGEGETVKIGSAPSPCSWKLDDPVRLELKRDGTRDVVYDWTFKENTHQERFIQSFRPDGVYLTYAAAKVVCMNFPQESESDYSPPSLRLRSRLRVGDTWRVVSNAVDPGNGNVERTETLTVRVKRVETVTVPAGTFSAYVVESVTTMTGGQEGTVSVTDWIVPSLGMLAKEVSRVNARSGSATFRSAYTLELSKRP